jgi:glycosyltransferase involved in cell wall biosynthesis
MARQLIREHRIDVVHQPIPVSPKESSVLHGLSVPVIIGPMNGGMSFPAGFRPSKSGGGSRFMAVARRASALVNRIMPGKVLADVLLVANERTRAALPNRVRGRVITLVENGVDLSLWSDRERLPREGGPVRFVFSGRLEDWKGADMLIEAFKGVGDQLPATLDVIGDGPQRGALESLVQRLALQDSVKLLGWLPQHQVAQAFREGDVFVLPSIYECGGAVVLEAMASGLPVIAAAWGGPADYLDDSCGILIPPVNREQLVAELRQAMLRLARSPELCRRMGDAGRRRIVESYDWERKIDRIVEVYREAVERRRCHAQANDDVRATAPAASTMPTHHHAAGGGD